MLQKNIMAYLTWIKEIKPSNLTNQDAINFFVYNEIEFNVCATVSCTVFGFSNFSYRIETVFK